MCQTRLLCPLLLDITNALMIISNLIALLGLRKNVIKETQNFFGRDERTRIGVRRKVEIKYEFF